MNRWETRHCGEALFPKKPCSILHWCQVENNSLSRTLTTGWKHSWVGSLYTHLNHKPYAVLVQTGISSIRCHPWIVAMASTCSAQTSVLIIPPWRVQRLFHVLRLVSTADSRTERLCVLLPASIRPSCIACMHLIQLSYLPASQRNKRYPRVVAVLKQTAKELVAEESCTVQVDSGWTSWYYSTILSWPETGE